MALKVNVENINFGVTGDLLNISLDVVLIDDTLAEGYQEVHRRSISAKSNFNNPDIKAVLMQKIKTQALDIVNAYKQKMGAIQTFYPDAQTPQEALSLFKTDIETALAE